MSSYIFTTYLKKALALVLILVLSLSAVTGCAEKEGEGKKQDSSKALEQPAGEGENKKEELLPLKEMDLVRTDYVWWEAEYPKETNFPEKTSYSLPEYSKNVWLFSGENWITNTGMIGEEKPFLKYEVEIKEDGEYYLWVRKMANYGYFKWRFDDQEWKNCLADREERDFTSITGGAVGLVWVNAGKISLTKGTHTFELQLASPKGSTGMAGYDCFLLSKSYYIPSGQLRPGERTNLVNEGSWAFEPGGEDFSESPIDLSYLNEDVAGQSGFIRRDGSNLVLGDGQQVRFWAVNVGRGIVEMEDTAIDYFARHLAKRGVNMVRIHGSIWDSNSNALSAVDKRYLNKIHYFVYAMKNQGIYTAISFYFPLWIKMDNPAFGFYGYNAIENKYPFALLQFNTEFQSIYKSWARELFKTVNPYTGVPLSDEPAVAIVEIQNEDSYLFWTFTRSNIPEEEMNKLERMFGNWLKERYGSIKKAMEAWGNPTPGDGDKPDEGLMRLYDAWFMTRDGHGEGAFRKRMSDQLHFLVEHQREFYEDMIDYYRNNLGVKSLISCSNWTTADQKVLDPLERYTYTAGDIIDRHGYYDRKHEGPNAGWSVSVGDKYESTSVLVEPETAIMQVNQVKDYPCMISETGWPSPNSYKAESVALWAAYGAMQGFDAIHFFAVGSVTWEPSSNKFALMIPSVFGQFPGYALMYRRGDVREAEAVVDMVHSLNELYNFKGTPIYETQALDMIRK